MDLPSIGIVKLIIWDLDDTFWSGTLSEGGIVYRRDTHDLVIALARRGVISSLCSNNDECLVRERLHREGVWDFFVLNQIGWGRKGSLVAQIIEDAQLSPQNVLFVDDRQANLDEASAASPGLLTLLPGQLPRLREGVLSQPESDPSLTRLARYRVLQAKQLERVQALAAGVREEEFLRDCRISVEEVSELRPHLDRIAELVERTNQLNFTRKRPGREELSQLLEDPQVKCGALRVSDRYGDYGLVGFWSLRTCPPAAPVLEHFLFSCRVLNMGVESWVFHRLGRPAIDTPHVPQALLAAADPDWIARAGVGTPQAPVAAQRLDQLRIFAKGGCMLDALLESMRKRAPNSIIHAELGQWSSHTISHSMMAGGKAARWVECVERWCSSTRYLLSELERSVVDLIVLELSKDIRCALYETVDGIVLPIAPVGFDLTQPESHALVAGWRALKGAAPGPWNEDPIYGDAGLEWLKNNCRYLNPQERATKLDESLKFVLSRILTKSPGARICLLTTPRLKPRELFPCWQHVPGEAGDAAARVARAAAGFTGVTTLPLDEYMEGASDFVTRSPFILSRRSCDRLATRLLE